jgi:heme A synthase
MKRVYVAGVVLGVALAAAVWLLTYRTWTLFEYIDRTHHHFRPSERVRVAPWWSVPATVAVLLAGTAMSLALLPGSRGMVRRLADHFSKVAERNQERRSDEAPPERHNHTIDAAGT